VYMINVYMIVEVEVTCKGGTLSLTAGDEWRRLSRSGREFRFPARRPSLSGPASCSLFLAALSAPAYASGDGQPVSISLTVVDDHSQPVADAKN